MFAPRSPRFIRTSVSAAVIAIAIGAAGNVRGQADGFTVQERPGLAMVKPQPWSKDNEATVVEFLAFTDRTVKGGSGAGYYEFRTKAADRRQVPASRITKLIIYPDPKQFSEILEPQDRETVAASVNEMKAIVAKYPATKSYLSPHIKVIADEVALYDSGKVKIDGSWISRDLYTRDQAGKIAASLKADIEKADPPGSMDLKNEARYLDLQKLADSSPGAKAALAEINDLYAKKVRFAQRNTLLARMANPALSMPDAESIVAQLKELQPAEDTRVVTLLKNWETSKASSDKYAAEGRELAAALETEMKSVTSEETPPQISAELDKSIGNLTDKMNTFMATKPLPPLIADCRPALTVCLAGTSFKKLKPLFEEKQFIESKDILDALARQAHNIGPETQRVVTGLSRTAAGQIEEFNRLREEARNLDSAGKQAEAIAKYEAALLVIPDKNVQAEIARLNEAAKTPARK